MGHTLQTEQTQDSKTGQILLSYTALHGNKCEHVAAADSTPLTLASMYSTRRSSVVNFSFSVANLDRHDMS